MRKLKLLLATLALFGGGSLVQAQTDVTSTYLTNPGFDDGETGWTFNGSGTTYHGVAAYGSSTAINSATNITVDKFGKNTGNAAFSNAGWGDESYYTQEVTLPAGSYKLTFDVINRFADKTGINENYFGWVPNSGNAVYSTTKTFEYNVWYTLSVTFTLTDNTTGKISCGMKSTSGSGSGAVAKLFIDNVKIFKMDEASAPTIANPIDYSDLIDQKTWNVQQDDNATPTTSSALVTNIANGDWTGRYTERYRGVAGHYGKALYQTVSVPAGVYQVQAACMSSSANNVDAAAGKKDGDVNVAYFYANASELYELTYPLSDKKGYYRKHIVTLDADGTIEFGINTKVVGANWNAIGCATVIKVANDYNSYIEDLLSESVAAWNTAHNNLAALDATLLPDAAEQAITEELAKARPNTQEEIESATDALQALIDSYDGIKAAFVSYKALKAIIEDLKNTSKYTFTGDEALSTFNTTLSTIDASAEAATDASTLTALLPSLKTAGNTFVGGIESNDGFDLTYNIVNNSFETGALSPWTTNGSNDTGVKPNSNGTYTTTGIDGSYLFNTWNNGAGSKVSQTISGLPTGYCTVTALVASDAGNTINIIAGSSSKAIAADAGGKGIFVEGTTDKVLVSEGSLEIGTNSSTWYKSDNFRLTYYTVKAGAAEAWAAAKATAEAAYSDEAYTNVTGSEKTELYAEIQKAEPTTAEAYGTATTALQEKTSAFTAAKDSYDGLVAMRTVGGTYTTTDWPRAAAAKKTALDEAIAAVPTNAEDAVTKTNAIVTAYRQFVESNGMAEGVAAAFEYTNTYLAGAAPDVNTGWTGGIGTDWRSNEIYTKGDGSQGGRYYDGGWSTSAAVNINMTRELTLPAGQYQLQITARGSDKLTSYTMSIGGETVDLPIEGSGATVGTFGHGWSDKYVYFESDGTTPLTLAIAASSTEYQQWISFNRLRLMRLDATFADATDYENLNTAITNAEAKTLGFENGEYAPYANAVALETLAAAKAIDQEANNEKDVVQALTTTLTNGWTANDGSVECVYNGNFAEELAGWTRSSNWGQKCDDVPEDVAGGIKTAFYNNLGSLQYGNTGVYTMPLKANTVYQLKYYYGAWDQTVTPTVSVLNEENGMAAMSFAATSTNYKKSMNSVDMVFVTGAAGNYVLNIAGNKNLVVTGVSIKKADSQVLVFADGSVPAYAPGTYPAVKIARTMTNTKWVTAVYPFALSMPAQLKSYVTVAEPSTFENGVLSFTSVTANEANKPFLMKIDYSSLEKWQQQIVEGLIADGLNLTNVAVAAAVAVDATAGDASLKGTYSSIEITNEQKNYVLFNNQIWKVGAVGATIDPYRAYIQLAPGATESRSLKLVVDGNETTAIEGIEVAEGENGNVYNLNGQRVQKAQKGLYIVNGKKVLK